MKNLVNVTWPLPAAPASCLPARDRALALGFLDVHRHGGVKQVFNGIAEAAFVRLLDQAYPKYSTHPGFVFTSEGGRA